MEAESEAHKVKLKRVEDTFSYDIVDENNGISFGIFKIDSDGRLSYITCSI